MSPPRGFSSDVTWPSDAERGKYTIGWIAPMPIELTPALALLDRITTLHVANDTNIYQAGKIGNHHVVMVTLDKIGLGGIPSVAAGMYASFRNLKHLLLVGLGGGIPEYALGDQMVLGDVVVSRQVEHLDCGRRTENGFEYTRQTYWPSPALLKAVNTLRSIHSLNGTRIRQTLQGIRQRLQPSNHEDPEDLGPDADQLFDADYHHQDAAHLCKNCCDYGRSKSRQDRGLKAYREKYSPLIHCGTIGSGNSLVVGSREREHFHEEFGTICFEMEAAALMDYHCLVIRGICDYSDSHKNKAWQPYAAATAAAYARELVMQLPAPIYGVNDDRQPRQAMNNQESSTSHGPDPVDTTALDRLNVKTGHVHWTVYRSRNPLFTGRDNILRESEARIRDAVKETSSSNQCSIVISGMGGQGKSEICLQLAHRVRQIFWGVFWVDVSSTTSAKNDFLSIAKKLGIQAESMEETRQGLANVKEPWLLVLDNADDPNADYQCYFPAGLLGVVIMTSRNRECRRYASTPAVELEGLPGSDARELLLHATNIPREQWHTFQDDAQEVASLLQSHPLALIQAGAYISSAHCTIAEYPQVFHLQRKRLLEFRPKQAQSRYGDVYATFEASVGFLEASQAEQAPQDAVDLFYVLSICAANPLPVGRLFEEGWKGAQSILSSNDSDDDLLRLKRWHVSHLPPLVQEDADEWDPFRLVEAVQLLRSLSLVSAETHEDSTNVSMHPLMHAWALDRLGTVDQKYAWLTTGCLVAVSNYRFTLLALGRQLQPHLEALMSLDMDFVFESQPPAKISVIILRCGWLLHNLGDYKKLKGLMDNLMIYLDLDPLVVDAKWLPVYDLFASNLMGSGKARKAVSLLEQVVQIQEQTLVEDHSDRLSSQQRLASAYDADGQAKNAISLHEQVVQIRDQTLAEDHPARLASQQELARAYRANGQVEKAISLLEQVFQIRGQTLAIHHPFRLNAQRQLALAYHANGELEKAVSLLEQVGQIEQQTLPEDDPDRLHSQHMLAAAYWANRNPRKSVSLLEQVIQIQEQKLAEDHPSRLKSQHDLARFYWRLGRRNPAFRMMKNVVEVKRKLLDECHPDRIISEEKLKIFEDEMIETEAAESCET